jgi:GNAT superfamily N-acetyltransferase
MKKIKDITGFNGDTLELWSSVHLSHTPCFALFIRTIAELAEKKLIAPTINFKNNNRVVWVQNSSGKVLGGIAYEFRPETLTGWLVLSFTDPEYRGQGINKICHSYYESDCKALGAVELASIVNIKNEARIKSAQKVGMVPEYFKMSKQI